jgi:hypothetical protein
MPKANEQPKGFLNRAKAYFEECDEQKCKSLVKAGVLSVAFCIPCNEKDLTPLRFDVRAECRRASR